MAFEEMGCHLSQLTSFDLESNENLLDLTIEPLLETTSQLQLLNLNDCPWVSGSIFANISPNLLNLRHLYLRNIRGLEKEGGLSRLTYHAHQLIEIDLFRCNDLTDTSIRDLTKNCSHLTSLNLDLCCYLTNNSLQNLGPNLPNLRSLQLEAVPIDDRGLREIARVQALNELVLKNTHVSGRKQRDYLTKLCNLRLVTPNYTIEDHPLPWAFFQMMRQNAPRARR